MQVQVSLKIEIAATADLSHMEQPTGCATRCTSAAEVALERALLHS